MYATCTTVCVHNVYPGWLFGDVYPDMPLYLCDLPHDLLRSSLRTASALDMGRMSRCSRLWLQLVDEVAERRLRARRPGLPPGSAACPCWLRSLATIEQVEVAVGLKPNRSWRDEYVPLCLATERAFAQDEALTDIFEPGGPLSLDARLEMHAELIVGATQAGFSTDDAEASCACLCSAAMSATLVQAWHAQGSTEFAATTHRLQEVYSAAGLRMWSTGTSHGKLYHHLGTGPPAHPLGDYHDGLIELDPAWERLTTSSIGDRIEIVACCSAFEPIEGVFQDEAGLYSSSVEVIEQADGEVERATWDLMESDIVCFLPPRPADRGGYHALVYEPAGAPDPLYPTDDCMWGLYGPLTVTLEAISEPGEWQVRGLSIRRRLYSVSISFG